MVPRWRTAQSVSCPTGSASDLPKAVRRVFHLLQRRVEEAPFQHTVPLEGLEGAHRHLLTVRGPDWFADPFHLSPGAKALLTLYGGEHLLGGISGYEAAETTDENPARVALVRKMTTAFLRSELSPGDTSWPDACAALAADEHAIGGIELK